MEQGTLVSESRWVVVGRGLTPQRKKAAIQTLSRSRLDWMWDEQDTDADLLLKVDDDAEGPYGLLRESLELYH